MYTFLNLQQDPLQVMKKYTLVLFLLLSSYLIAAQKDLSFNELDKVQSALNNRDPKKVLPHELKAYHKESIGMRGFVFEAPSGEWVLASKPNLKSCCIGAEKEVFNQVYLECRTDPTFHNKLVNVDGQFHVEVLENAEGELVRVYTMKNAKVQKVQAKEIPFVTISILVILLLLFLFRKKLRRRS